MKRRKQEASNRPSSNPDPVALLIVIAVVGVLIYFLTRKKKGAGALSSELSRPIERWKHWKPFDD